MFPIILLRTKLSGFIFVLLKLKVTEKDLEGCGFGTMDDDED